MSLGDIATTLRATAGIEAEALGARHLADAVERLTARAGVDAEAYAGLVAADAVVRESLVAELLVHETSFFRYPASFAHLASFAVARAAARPGPVRVLSAACATGQEAWSVAMTLLEAGLPPERVAVDAFDRSASAVETARAGRYERGGTRGLDPERAARWFDHDGGALTIVPEARARVRFEVGDLLAGDRPFAGAAYDAVFCRNLLIYLTADARRRALAALRVSLAPDGILYLGHAEVLVARAEGFAPVAAAATYACVATAADHAPAIARRRDPLPIVSPPSAPRSVRPTSVPPSLPAPESAPAPIPPLERARDLADAGRLAEATTLLEAEVERGRPGPDHFHLLALVRRAAGRPREADEALGRALYLDPTHVGALLLAAVAAEGRGERQVAARLHARARAAVQGRR